MEPLIFPLYLFKFVVILFLALCFLRLLSILSLPKNKRSIFRAVMISMTALMTSTIYSSIPKVNSGDLIYTSQRGIVSSLMISEHSGALLFSGAFPLFKRSEVPPKPFTLTVDLLDKRGLTVDVKMLTYHTKSNSKEELEHLLLGRDSMDVLAYQLRGISSTSTLLKKEFIETLRIQSKILTSEEFEKKLPYMINSFTTSVKSKYPLEVELTVNVRKGSQR